MVTLQLELTCIFTIKSTILHNIIVSHNDKHLIETVTGNILRNNIKAYTVKIVLTLKEI